MKSSEETVELALRLSRELGSDTKASSELRRRGFQVAGRTIGHWRRGYINTDNRKRTKSELLNELAEIIRRCGPEVPMSTYRLQSKNSEAYRYHWKAYSEFRFEAARLCPYSRKYNTRAFIEVKDGLIIVGSDAHYWPYWGQSTMHRFMVQAVKEYRPSVVIMNGDICDFPQLSTHRPIAWKEEPEAKDELAEITERLAEIKKASRGARLMRTWGNHCIRFDNRLVEGAGKFRGIGGMSLTEHLPEWEASNAIRVNETELEIKHRFKGGIYSTRLNPLHAGISYCAGHDHNAQLHRLRNLVQSLWGVNTGMMAEPWGPQFEYQENNPSNHEGAIAFLQFKDHKMLPPELAIRTEAGKVFFRGQVYTV